MLTQRPDQRVAVFIDTQNMYHSAKHIFNRKVSFANLVEAAVGPRILTRAIAYVACDPAALARDTATFLENGYALAGLRCFDAFPMTHHVETVARLVPTGSPLPS